MTNVPTGQPSVLGDRYDLQDLIGRGGMAEVYRARDQVLDRAVAVKVMRALSSTDTDRARFSDEARTLARLSHPGLVTVLDAATSGDQPYLVMELVQGPSLRTNAFRPPWWQPRCATWPREWARLPPRCAASPAGRDR